MAASCALLQSPSIKCELMKRTNFLCSPRSPTFWPTSHTCANIVGEITAAFEAHADIVFLGTDS